MKKFTNYTGQEFTCSWDGKEYTFLPGESAIFEDGIAKAFAKHLANKKYEGTLIATDALFIAEMEKALSDATEETQAEVVVEQIFEEIKEEPTEEIIIEEEQPKKKGRKAKKEIFEGLEDETNI